MDTKFNENNFKSYIKPHILKCRSGDWSHAQQVVKWVKELGKKRDDLYLLIVSAYIHDIGWRDVLPQRKIAFNDLLKFEEVANKNSEPFIRSILESLKYTENEISVVLRLVKATDDHKSNAEDEAILVDADNLSKLDISHLKEKFIRDDWLKMYKLWEDTFPNRIKTFEGRKIYPKLLKKLMKESECSHIK